MGLFDVPLQGYAENLREDEARPCTRPVVANEKVETVRGQRDGPSSHCVSLRVCGIGKRKNLDGRPETQVLPYRLQCLVLQGGRAKGGLFTPRQVPQGKVGICRLLLLICVRCKTEAKGREERKDMGVDKRGVQRERRRRQNEGRGGERKE